MPWYLPLFAQIVVGLLLLIGGITKLCDLRRFTEMVLAYRVGSVSIAKTMAKAIPLTEVLLGTFLLLRICLPWSALASAALLFLFNVAITFNLLRGHHDISCGCLGVRSDQPLSWTIVAQNAGFIFLALLATNWRESEHIAETVVYSPNSGQQFTMGDTVATSLAALSFLGVCWLWNMTQGLLHRHHGARRDMVIAKKHTFLKQE